MPAPPPAQGAGPLRGWAAGTHTADGVTHPTYRKGGGPAVIVVHEIPGITPETVELAEDVVARGFTVVMPVLFGAPGRPATIGYAVRELAKICVNRELTSSALGTTTPVAGWLRSLARGLHDELGGPGVGVIGMCFSGGFALAVLADAPVAAPVLAQPSDLPLSRARRADLGLSAEDLARARTKVAAGCPVLGLRFAGDPMVGTRFDTLRRELGDSFLAVEFPGRRHATLTLHRQQEAVDRVLQFLAERLQDRSP